MSDVNPWEKTEQKVEREIIEERSNDFSSQVGQEFKWV